MAKLNINTGASDNDKTGDTLRSAFGKINQNFTELYTLTGGTSNSIIDSINPLTISRNGMTIRVTSAGMIQMSFNSVITITGRSSINNADSVVILSPNGATTSGTWYNIGAVLAAADHLTATIVDRSFHRIYRLTAIMREKGTTPGSEFATAYAIIEQLQ